MRFVVLLFGFFGVLFTAIAAIALLFHDGVLAEVHGQFKIPKETMDLYSDKPTNISPGNAALFFFLVTAYGLFGVLLAFFRCGKQGGALILISVILAAMVNPYMIPLLSVLGFTALLCFFVGPLPINPPKEKDEVEVEEDD